MHVVERLGQCFVANFREARDGPLRRLASRQSARRGNLDTIVIDGDEYRCLVVKTKVERTVGSEECPRIGIRLLDFVNRAVPVAVDFGAFPSAMPDSAGVFRPPLEKTRTRVASPA